MVALFRGFRKFQEIDAAVRIWAVGDAPKLRGPELASRMRLRYPDLKVVYMSGYTESALVRDGILERNTVLLQKPFNIKKIMEAIQQLNAGVRS